jgi:hypothetical protein
VNGRIVGGRGLRLMSKIGQQAISLNRLEQLLAEAQRSAGLSDTTKKGQTPC